MPIIDNELVGEGPTDPFEYPNVPAGEYLEAIIKKNLDERGDSTWMTDASTGKSMTFSQLHRGMRSVSSYLWKKGFQVNDTVLFMASNHLEVPLLNFGVWKAGGNVACLTLNLHSNDIRSRAIENQATFILTDEVRAPRVLEAVGDLHFVKEVIVIGQFEGCTPVDLLLEDDGSDCPDNLKINLDSTAWLMYSSGTTGIPKGIVHSHLNITAIFKSYTAFPVAGRKILFINLMINSGGMVMALLSTIGHGQAITLSSLSDDSLLAAVHANKPDVISAFPSQIAWICRHPNLDQFDLSSVSMILTGGSCINPIYEREIFDKLPNLLLLNIGYGLSETGMVTSNAPKAAELKTLNKKSAGQRHLIGSCGKVIAYCRLKVIDVDTGNKLGPGQIGEVCVKTPYLLKEYLNKPKETASALQNGWFHTGDKGYYDNDENVFIIGRYKELIKYRMAHVVPSNIEKHMMTHSAIEDVGVVGQQHDVDGELPVAFVVLRTGSSSVTVEDIVNYTNGLVIEEEKLRGGVRFIDKIPRNELGKVIRPQLAKML